MVPWTAKGYRQRVTRGIAVAAAAYAFSCAEPGATAAPTGLNLIPTAEVLPRRAASLELEATGSGLFPGRRSTQAALSQIGLTSRLEAGLDHALRHAPGDSLFNAKWQVVASARGGPALAVGVQSVAGGYSAERYLMLMQTVGSLRLHAGAFRAAGTTRLLAGLDRPLGTTVLQADHIGGGEGVTSVGLAVPLGRCLSLTYAITFPTGRDPVGHLANLALLLGG
jgi:hypothetical protein